MRHLWILLVTFLLAVLVGACQSSSTCTQADPCPTVDEQPSPGDMTFDALDPRSVAIFSVGDATFAEFALVGGSLALALSEGGSTPTLKRLRLLSADVSVELSSGGRVTLSQPTLLVASPLELTLSASGYVIPAGTVVHTCATIGGQPWHSSAPLGAPVVLTVEPGAFASLDGVMPLVARANDAQCSPFTFQASVAASWGP